MDPKLTEVAQVFARFKAAYARNDLDACVTLLSQLKVRAAGPAGSVSPPFPSPSDPPALPGDFAVAARGWDFTLAAWKMRFLSTSGSMVPRDTIRSVFSVRHRADPVTPARWVSPCFGRFPFGSRVSSHPSPIGLHSAAGNGEKGRIFSSFS